MDCIYLHHISPIPIDILVLTKTQSFYSLIKFELFYGCKSWILLIVREQ